MSSCGLVCSGGEVLLDDLLTDGGIAALGRVSIAENLTEVAGQSGDEAAEDEHDISTATGRWMARSATGPTNRSSALS